LFPWIRQSLKRSYISLLWSGSSVFWLIIVIRNFINVIEHIILLTVFESSRGSCIWEVLWISHCKV
jgi:hypothetical protein